jgi:uncharacterized protein
LGDRLKRFLVPAIAGMTISLSAMAGGLADPGHLEMTAGIARGHTQLRSVAQPPAAATISIIIDDLGQMHAAGLRAVALPGDVALAFLPGTPLARSQAEMAHARGKEVLLHLPLEPGGNVRAYPTAITTSTRENELGAFFEAALASVPHARGVNNHQGSRLTALTEPMDWLMSAMAMHPGLYFVDSRTSAGSVAFRAALAHRVPAAERQVFLDNDRGEENVRRAFHELVARARQNERALAIGHPYPETLKVLEQEIPRLGLYGVRLVAPSELIARREGRPSRQLKLIANLSPGTTPRSPGLPGSTSAAAH